MSWKTSLAETLATVRAQGVGAGVKRAAVEGQRAAQLLGGVGADRGRLIWGDDWDICVVVDSCRLDCWMDVAPEFEWLVTDDTAWSVGSASPEWIASTFQPTQRPDFEDVGVVTANPFYTRDEEVAGDPDGVLPLDPDAFAAFDDVWRDDRTVTVDGVDLYVTDPGLVVDRALAAWHDHDLDRLVVHVMQPHCPFRARAEWFDPDETDDRDGWRRVRDGDLPADEFWTAYEENLRWALSEVDRLRRSVAADLLVTSDHGNGMGEWGVWSHPVGVHTPSVRRVPWVTLDGTDELDATPTVDQEDRPMTDTVDERLEALGYA